MGDSPEIHHFNTPGFNLDSDLELLFGELAKDIEEETEAAESNEEDSASYFDDEIGAPDFVAIAKNLQQMPEAAIPVVPKLQSFMPAPVEDAEFGLLQEIVDSAFADAAGDKIRNLDLIVQAELSDVSADLMEIVEMLPPGPYTREQLIDQLNSILVAHGWSYRLGTLN